MRRLVLASVVLAACGDDAPPPPPQAATPSTQAAGQPGAKKGDDKDKLQVRTHAEDRVDCPVRDAEGTAKDKSKFFYGTGPDCVPEKPKCAPGLWCVAARTKENQDGFKCEPCPERDSIRHEFKDRDFVAEMARDPFQSFVIVRPELGKPSENAKEPLGPCTRSDQLRASSYSYQELKLVGIVGAGTKRTALMMNSRNVGEFVRRGDCVGKEKALVADIVLHDQTACVTFQVTPEQSERGPRLPAREVPPVCLYPNGLPEPESLPTLPGENTGPQVAPPPGTPQVAPPPGTPRIAPPPAAKR
jgi:hypothetical protein